MRYRQTTHHLHPVLRPQSDDFPRGEFQTTVTSRKVTEGEAVAVEVEFALREATIQSALSDGRARCAAMFYCARTLYRDTVVAPSGSLRVVHRVPMHLLSGAVEVNPFVLATEPIGGAMPTAHAEYQAVDVSVPSLSPLMQDVPWHFHVDPEQRAVESIFQIQADDENLSDGQFDVEIDPANRYIVIRMCDTTKTKFDLLRTQDPEVMKGTVVLGALMEGLEYVANDDADVEEGNGWVHCLRQHIREKGLSLARDSRFRTAQVLLREPMAAVLANRESSSSW